MTVYINLSAICRNWDKINKMSKGVAGAVVKANAYGLGAEPIAEALYDSGCRVFFTATVEEAVALRPAVGSSTIYALHGVLNHYEIAACLKHNIRPVINHMDMWHMLQKSGAPLHVAVHFDTGMHRLGVPEYDRSEMLLAIRQPNALKVCMVMSHFASSDMKDAPENKRQQEVFAEIVGALPYIETSLANSSGVFLGEEYHGDIVRVGFALYGGNPTPGKENPMESVFEIQPRILQVQNVKKGDVVGYNSSWTIDKDRCIATVELGYSDFNSRDVSATCGSNSMKIIGPVNMDTLTLDVTYFRESMNEISLRPTVLEGLSGRHALTSLGSRHKKEYVYG